LIASGDRHSGHQDRIIMTDKVLFEREGNIAVLTLNQPETRNALTDIDLVDGIVGALEAANRDMEIRALIVTGAGLVFSSGGNIKHMRDKIGTFKGNAEEVRENYRVGIQRIPLAFHDLEIPSIAAVNGPAYGAGCDLTLMCDIRIASNTAIFAENFVKVGIIPGDGGAWFLPRVIGLPRAMEMTFTGEPIDALKAQEWGIVSEVVAPEELLVAAKKMAARIAANPPQALRWPKKLLRAGQLTPLDELLDMAGEFQGKLHQSEDHLEAVNAILEKRKPVFTGK
jgi:enoyl-CoA hydratase/carnithine racemase